MAGKGLLTGKFVKEEGLMTDSNTKSKKPISCLDLFISIHLAGGFLFGKNHLWILRLVEMSLVELTVSFLLTEELPLAQDFSSPVSLRSLLAGVLLYLP